MSFSLRPYQERARDALRARFREGHRAVLLVAPTGAGKTVSAVDVIALAVERGNRVLFVANRTVLIDQTSDKLSEAGLHDHGVIMSDHPRRRPSASVQVASIQTLLARDHFPPADLVIVDEAQDSASPGYRRLKAAYPEALFLGLSATPFRLDGQSLSCFFDSYVVAASLLELIQQGFLVQPRVWAPSVPDLRGVPTRGKNGDFVEDALAKKMDTPQLVGDLVRHWQRLAPGKPTVAFSSSVAHAASIAKRFLEAGIPSESLDGTMPSRRRSEILHRLESGETLVVASCGVLSVGWDSPPTEAAILARPTQSLALYIQQVGRVLRPWEGKREALILDHAGNTVRHGFVTDPWDIDWGKPTTTPAKDAVERGSAKAKRCPRCFLVVGLFGRLCTCGFEFRSSTAVPKEKDGVLFEVTEATRVPARPRPSFDEQQEYYERMDQERHDRAYKAGWTAMRFKDHFGFYPTVVDGRIVNVAALTTEQAFGLWRDIEGQRIERGYKPNWSYWRYAHITGGKRPPTNREAVA